MPSLLYGRRADRETYQNREDLLQNPGSFEPSHRLNYYEIARTLDCELTQWALPRSQAILSEKQL